MPVILRINPRINMNNLGGIHSHSKLIVYKTFCAFFERFSKFH